MTLVGIVADVSDVHDLKAPLPSNYDDYDDDVVVDVDDDD